MKHPDGVYEYRTKDVIAETGICLWTLIKWANDGLVDHRRSSDSTHSKRRYCNRSIEQVLHLMTVKQQRRRRVS